MNTMPSFQRESGLYPLQRPPLTDGDLKGAALVPETIDALARRQGREYEALNNGLFQAQAKITVADQRIASLQAELTRVERAMAKTNLGDVIVTAQRDHRTPFLHKVAAYGGMIASGAALVAGNLVGAGYVTASGNDFFVGQPTLAPLFMALPALGGLALKFHEVKLRSDRARRAFATTLFATAAMATLSWMGLATWFFSPEAGQALDWMAEGNATLDKLMGAGLVFTHLLGDTACSYVVLSGAAFLMRAGRRRVFVPDAGLQALADHRDRLFADIATQTQLRAEAEDFIRRFDEGRLATEEEARIRANGALLVLGQIRKRAAASAEADFLN